MMIDDEDQARRLARAICSDVLLYNAAAVKDAPAHERAGLLAEPLREGRELFASRVTARWAHVFDGEVAELMTRQLGLQGSSSNVAPNPLTRPSLADPVLPDRGGAKGIVFIILVLTLVAAGAAAFFLFGR